MLFRRWFNISPDSDKDFFSLQLNLLRQQETFVPNPVYLAKLNDAGANFTHKLKDKLKLTDTYINLSLRELHLDINEPEAKPVKIKVNDLVNELTKSQFIFVTGSDKSGKSSIAKRLYTDLLSRGYIPLAVDGRDMRAKTSTQVNQSIEAEHKKQYAAESYNRYRQVDVSRKVLIIDDFHLVNLNTDTRIKALKQIGGIYGHIVILLGSHTPFLDEVDLTSSEIDYKYYSIDPLNHSLREDAIQRWILMDDDGSIDKISMLKRIDAARTVVDTVIGNHYVPSYPFFVLSVLQVFHEGVSIDSQSTSLGMGYFYERLIRSALNKALENMEISGALAYLSYIANTFWEKGQKKVVNKEFREIHRQYCEEFDISEEDFAYETTITLFVEAGMLEQSGGEVKFKYDQNYYEPRMLVDKNPREERSSGLCEPKNSSRNKV